MAESRSQAVLINGRSGKQRALAAAPGCSELAGAAARLLLGAGAGACPQPARRQEGTPAAVPTAGSPGQAGAVGQGMSSQSSGAGMGCRDLTWHGQL